MGFGAGWEISGRLNNTGYIDILENFMIPSVKSVFGSIEGIQFMQNHAPFYQSRETRRWLESHPEMTVIK